MRPDRTLSLVFPQSLVFPRREGRRTSMHCIEDWKDFRAVRTWRAARLASERRATVRRTTVGPRCKRQGSALLLMTGVIFTALAIAAYAINVAYMQSTRTELQIATDVASRAACRALVDTGDRAQAYRAAQRLVDENLVAGRRMHVSQGDLKFLAATRKDQSSGYHYRSDSRPNAVRFDASFFSRPENSLSMLFPSFVMAMRFEPFKDATATLADLDVAIVLDCSSSMLAPTYLPSPPELPLGIPLPVAATARWRMAVHGIDAVIASAKQSPCNEQLSLVTFHDLSALNVPLVSEYELIQAALAVHSTAYLGGNSRIADGLTSASTLLQSGMARAWASRVILLISDGKENLGSNAYQKARAIAESGIMIYTISLGVDADERLMQQIASAGHGRHFHAWTADDFRNSIAEIHKHLPVLITR